ncbi:unnamed protein product [Sphenostylis stenocarpa]|uniref:Alpha-carbonic anhydrase domain-containing protein n=1 Tax=Sphenostylis stenocarpa TaxID=92480 RepID=A0AA86VHW3_9FABA|nr:unnamed protein product [Sphenostylis stenocarpa]
MDLAMAIQAFAHFILIVLLFPAATSGEKYVKFELCLHNVKHVIDLRKHMADVVSNSRIQRNYQPANATLLSSDHDIMVNWTENAGYITINETQYQLLQGHWHSPSEHKINGMRYDLELELVMQNNLIRAAVDGAGDVAIKLNDVTMANFCEDLGLVAKALVKGWIFRFCFVKLFQCNNSATGNQCLKETFENARPMQPRNGRTVQLYLPKDHRGN